MAPTTAAANSEHVHLGDAQEQTFMVVGLQGTEKATVQISTDAGVSFTNVWDRIGKMEFSATCNTIVLRGPGTFRIHKQATADPVGVSVAGLACGV